MTSYDLPSPLPFSKFDFSLMRRGMFGQELLQFPIQGEECHLTLSGTVSPLSNVGQWWGERSQETP